MFEVICEQNVLEEELACDYFKQIVEAVTECHNMGVIHGDIKAENIIVDLLSNKIRLIDFGSGHLVQEDFYTKYEGRLTDFFKSILSPSYHIGTRAFSPPEWLLYGRYHGAPATVWSLGILLYAMVCGYLPFVDDKDIISAQVIFANTVSQECRGLVRECLKSKTKERIHLDQILLHPWAKKTVFHGN